MKFTLTATFAATAMALATPAVSETLTMSSWVPPTHFL